MGKKKIMHSTQHGSAFNVLATIYYFFSVKQNVKDIFIDSHRTKGQQKASNILISIKLFDKNFEDIIENEVNFHDYGTAEIEIQQQPHDINPLTCQLHQTTFDVLDFNPALKVINITLAYEYDESNIVVYTPLLFDWGVEPPTKFSKLGWELDMISIFRGGSLLGKGG